MSELTRVPRHLIDPANPRRPQPGDRERLERVQRWVLSTLAVTTILHLSAGLVVAALVMDPDRSVDRIGLVALAGLFGMVSVASGLAIHRHRLLTPWLLLGLVPGVVGAVLLAAG
jgi:hypothetical protein